MLCHREMPRSHTATGIHTKLLTMTHFNNGSELKWMRVFCYLYPARLSVHVCNVHAVRCQFCDRELLGARVPAKPKVQFFLYCAFFATSDYTVYISRTCCKQKTVEKPKFRRFEPIILLLCKLFIYFREDKFNSNTHA